MPAAFWICALVSLISAAVSFGYSVAGVRGTVGADRTSSLYALSRSLALLVVAVAAPFTGSTAVVAAVALAMVIVQAVDALVGSKLHSMVKTLGPVATATANLVALIWLLLS